MTVGAIAAFRRCLAETRLLFSQIARGIPLEPLGRRIVIVRKCRFLPFLG
jgi:hypothetical protein